MDYKKITQKILEIHTTKDGFDETDFTEHLEDFFYLKLGEKTQVTQEHIAKIAHFIWQEKFSVTKVEISEVENDPTYYDKKWEEVIDREESVRESSNDNELPPIDVIIGGEKDIFLYELLSKFDELRDDIQKAIIEFAPTERDLPEAELLINKGLAEYETLLQQITGKKETTFEIQNLLNTYLREYAAEIHKEEESSNAQEALPEAKIIRLPPFLKK